MDIVKYKLDISNCHVDIENFEFDDNDNIFNIGFRVVHRTQPEINELFTLPFLYSENLEKYLKRNNSQGFMH